MDDGSLAQEETHQDICLDEKCHTAPQGPVLVPRHSDCVELWVDFLVEAESVLCVGIRGLREAGCAEMAYSP